MSSYRDKLAELGRKAMPWMAVVFVGYLVFVELGRGSHLTTGSEAPPLAVDLSTGERFDLAKSRGRVVVVNFWAAWCPPCRTEAPVLTEAHRKIQESGGLVVGVSTDPASLAEVAKSAERLGMHYPVAVATGDILDMYQVQSLPTTYVVSRNGTIVRSFVGAVSEQELDDAIEEAFAQTEPT